MFQKHRNFVQEHINFVQEYKKNDQESMEFFSIGFSNCEDEQYENYKQNKTQFSWFCFFMVQIKLSTSPINNMHKHKDNK
jgi:hypothetical protein